MTPPSRRTAAGKTAAAGPSTTVRVGRVCAAIRRDLDAGDPWSACDRYREAQSAHPRDNPALLVWGAMAHARAGARSIAHQLLDHAEACGAAADLVLHESLLSLRGRLHKDMLGRGAGAAAEQAALAFDSYHAAYALRRDPFPGINAASMAWLAGDKATARALAREVAARLAATPEPHDTWHHASVGEAALLLGDAGAARDAYRAAHGSAHPAASRGAAADSGSTARMRQQLQLLAATLPRAAEMLPLLPAPTVIAFCGHMVDAPGRPQGRFPAALTPAVGRALHEHLARQRQPIVFTSAACGADLLLVEAALALGAEVNIVLPFEREDFLRSSVAIGGSEWVPRFERALSAAHRVVMATNEAYLDDDALFEHAARLVDGLACLRAAQLACEPSLLAVLARDAAAAGAEPGPVGGTAATVQRWRARQGRITVIDLDTLAAQAAEGMPAPPRAVPTTTPATHSAPKASQRSDATQAWAAPRAARPVMPHGRTRSLKTLLFADFAGFGRLRDAQAPLFHDRFLHIVASCIADAPAAPIQANTWGDALYAVFDSGPGGAEFAWHLLQRMRAVDWKAAGLGSNSQIRIALHAGPVFRGFDPVIGRDNHFGSSVTETARIEPVTQPGTIYASEAFAATLAGSGEHGFILEYLGSQALAKSHGAMRLYRVDRVQEPTRPRR